MPVSLKSLQLAARSISLVIGLCLNIAALADPGLEYCYGLLAARIFDEASYREPDPDGSYRQVVVTTSSALKELNESVFVGQGLYSEIFVKSLQRLFVHHFFEINRRAGSAQSLLQHPSYLKHVEIGVSVASPHRTEVISVADLARELAIQEFADLVWNTSPASLSKRIKEGDSQLPTLSLVSSTRLPEFELADIGAWQQRLRGHFGSIERLQSFLGATYGAGLGTHPIDALFASREAVNARSNTPVSFEFGRFNERLRALAMRRQELPFLSRLTSGEFQVLVKLAKSGDPRILMAELKKRGDLATLSDSMLRDLADKIMLYARELNVLDYLPHQWIEPGQPADFTSLDAPVALLYVDIRGLGAKGITAIHERFDGIYQLGIQVEDLFRKYARQDSAELNMTIMDKMRQLFQSRQQILESANEYLSGQTAELFELLQRIGAQAEHLRIWRSGDDIVVLVGAFAGERTREQIELFLIDHYARSNLRLNAWLGIEFLQDRSSLSAEQARLQLGRWQAQVKGLKGPESVFLTNYPRDGESGEFAIDGPIIRRR